MCIRYTGQHQKAKFYYHGVLITSRAEPPTGPTNGGTVVALYGRFEHLADVRCRFGQASTAIAVPRLVDGSRIECTTTPQAVPEAQNVHLTVNGQQFAESTIAFVYHAPLAVISLLPTIFKHEGNTIVTLRANRDLPLGTLTQGYRFCHFDAVNTPASLIGTDTLTCAAPALAPGYAAVEITVNGQDYTATGIQAQLVQVVVNALQPMNGPKLGGTRVVVYGTNLFDVFSCLFAGQAAVLTQTHGRHRMVCMTNAFVSTGWVVMQLCEGVYPGTEALTSRRPLRTVCKLMNLQSRWQETVLWQVQECFTSTARSVRAQQRQALGQSMEGPKCASSALVSATQRRCVAGSSATATSLRPRQRGTSTSRSSSVSRHE